MIEAWQIQSSTHWQIFFVRNCDTQSSGRHMGLMILVCHRWTVVWSIIMGTAKALYALHVFIPLPKCMYLLPYICIAFAHYLSIAAHRLLEQGSTHAEPWCRLVIASTESWRCESGSSGASTETLKRACPFLATKFPIRVQVARAHTRHTVRANWQQCQQIQHQQGTDFLQQVHCWVTAVPMFNNPGKAILRVQTICCEQQSYQPCP